MSRRFDIQKFIFRLNLILTGIIFFLMSPTLRVYRSWFPEKKNSLWLYPIICCVISAFLWFGTSLLLPRLIKKGLVKDLRGSPREQKLQGGEYYWKIARPIVMTLFHALLVIFIAVSMTEFLRKEPFMNLFKNIPETKRFAGSRAF